MHEVHASELLHAEIDGALDEHQRADLARAVLADRALAAERAALHRLAAMLASVPLVEPPPDLAARILAALPAMPRSQPGAAPRTAPAWLRAAAFAAVIATGGLVYALVGGHGPAATDLTGTLVRAPAPTFLDTAQLAGGPVVGRVGLSHDAAGYRLHLDVQAARPVQVLIRVGDPAREIRGQVPGMPSEVALPALTPADLPVELRFWMDGREVGSATLGATARR